MQFDTEAAAKLIATHSVGVGVQGIGIGAVVFGFTPVHNVGVMLGVSVGVGEQLTTAKGYGTTQSVGVNVAVGVQVAIWFAAPAVIGP